MQMVQRHGHQSLERWRCRDVSDSQLLSNLIIWWVVIDLRGGPDGGHASRDGAGLSR